MNSLKNLSTMVDFFFLVLSAVGPNLHEKVLGQVGALERVERMKL